MNLCPCNSGVPYANCCQPLLTGEHPAFTAEALMRSRYTAYVLRDTDYLLSTWHPSTRPVAIDPATIPDWYGLLIIHTENGGVDDTEGVVEFKATALARKEFCRFQEVSRFVKEDGQWLYVDGELKGERAPRQRRVQKVVGRNEPCPCGSGKKFKKCCGP